MSLSPYVVTSRLVLTNKLPYIDPDLSRAMNSAAVSKLVAKSTSMCQITGMAKKVVIGLFEIGSQPCGFAHPRTHLIYHSCNVNVD